MRIVISGTVGIGKSTTTKLLVNKLNEMGYEVSHLDEETVDSIYLDYYYKAPQD
jgi:deoxyadenosine/deoxycytidine kinase